MCAMVALMVAETARAQDSSAFVTGNDLLAYCKTPAGAGPPAMCRGYITATVDTVVLYQDLESIPRRVCLPRNVTVQQVVDVVVAYLVEYPADRHNTAVSIAVPALWKAFPCPPK